MFVIVTALSKSASLSSFCYTVNTKSLIRSKAACLALIMDTSVKYQEWTLARIKQELKSRGAKTTGRKAELVERYA